jgi:hypothetical protein
MTSLRPDREGGFIPGGLRLTIAAPYLSTCEHSLRGTVCRAVILRIRSELQVGRAGGLPGHLGD